MEEDSSTPMEVVCAGVSNVEQGALVDGGNITTNSSLTPTEGHNSVAVAPLNQDVVIDLPNVPQPPDEIKMEISNGALETHSTSELSTSESFLAMQKAGEDGILPLYVPCCLLKFAT